MLKLELFFVFLTTGVRRPLCKRPSDIRQGAFTPQRDKFTVDSTVTYVCNDKYRLRGNSELTCSKNGKWSPTQLPRCTKSNWKILFTVPFKNMRTLKFKAQLTNKCVFCYRQSNFRRILPVFDYCRALFRCTGFLVWTVLNNLTTPRSAVVGS